MESASKIDVVEAASKAADMCCGTCVFWILTHKRGEAGMKVAGGQCRANPPVPLVIQSIGKNRLTGEPGMSTAIQAHFPSTSEDMFCGSYDTGNTPEDSEPPQ